MATTTQELAAKLWRKVDAFKSKTGTTNSVSTPGFVVSVIRHQMAKLETRQGHCGAYDRVRDVINKVDDDPDPVEKWDAERDAIVDAHAKVEDILLLALVSDQELPKYLAANDAWFVRKAAILGGRPEDLSYLSSGRSCVA